MKKSYVMAGFFAGILVLWMLPGFFGAPKSSTEEGGDKKAVMSVEVRTQSAGPVTSVITAQGDVSPNREVTLRAETNGTVKDILIEEGERVKEGDVILRLDMDDRAIRLERARARMAEARRKYEAANALGKKGYAAQSRVDEALALLKDAEAEEKQILLEIEHTDIRAPFEGLLDKRMIEIGDYVSVRDEIITVVDNTPLVVAVPVPQHEIGHILVGGPAMIVRPDGKQATGRIRFVAPKASSTTRTFRVEIEVPNPEGLASGTSASVFLPKESVQAHAISPGILTLAEDGQTGVKIVDENDAVHFYPVKIVSAQPNMLYVTGLPEIARVIVNGQGYVRSGEIVRPVESSAQTGNDGKSELSDMDSGEADKSSGPEAAPDGAPSEDSLESSADHEKHSARQEDKPDERVD